MELLLQELYSLDVRRIGIINLPPLGCLPFQKTLRMKEGRECAEELNTAAAEFNAKLISIIEGLKPELTGLKVISLNYYGIVLDAIQHPAKYGMVQFYCFVKLQRIFPYDQI